MKLTVMCTMCGFFIFIDLLQIGIIIILRYAYIVNLVVPSRRIEVGEKTLKQKFRVAKNEDIPVIGRLLAKNPAAVYVQSIIKENPPVLLTTIIRQDVTTELLFGYNTLHGIEEVTGRTRSLRIVEETDESVDSRLGRKGETKKNVVQSHYLGTDGWWQVPLEIAKIYIPR